MLKDLGVQQRSIGLSLFPGFIALQLSATLFAGERSDVDFEDYSNRHATNKANDLNTESHLFPHILGVQLSVPRVYRKGEDDQAGTSRTLMYSSISLYSTCNGHE
jgi:hypothetical protein